MLAGRIDAVTTAKAIHAAQHIVCAAGGDVIKVQCNNIPAGHAAGLAAWSVEGAGDIAADVLQVVLLGLGKRKICMFRAQAFAVARRTR